MSVIHARRTQPASWVINERLDKHAFLQSRPKQSVTGTTDSRERIGRILTEQRQQARLRARGLAPRRKLLLVGPPGSGKTMTAAALAGELKLPLFTAFYDGLIGRRLGETASRLRLVLGAIAMQRGVCFSTSSTRSERSGPGRTTWARSAAS